MARKYYAIDENAVRQAQSMWSLTDYVVGSKTAEYKRLVDKAYDLADQVAEKRPGRAEQPNVIIRSIRIFRSILKKSGGSCMGMKSSSQRIKLQSKSFRKS